MSERHPEIIVAPSILSADFARLGEEIRAIGAALSETLWLEKVVLATHAPPAVNSTAPADDFEALLAALTDDSAIRGDLNADLTDFLSKAPAELDQDVELIAEARAGRLGPLLADAADALRARLGGGRPG